jgi:PAS domain S-box-containing protein
VALVLFFPEEDNSSLRGWENRSSQILGAADELASIIAEKSKSSFDKLQLNKEINNVITNSQIITRAELLYYNTVVDEMQFVHLGNTVNEKSNTNGRLYSGFYDIMLEDSKSKESGYFTLLSQDKKNVDFVIYPEALAGKAVLILSSNNDINTAANNNIAYLLLLLFLISTLISLLIINLISRGVKLPLNRLMAGFEKVAAGEECYVEVAGDKQLNHVISGFNSMVETLTEKKNELEKSNTKLTEANKSLAESGSILTSLVDFSPEAILVTDLEDKIIIFNMAACEAFGLEECDLHNHKITDFLPSSEVIHFERVERDYETKPSEIICRHYDRSKFPALLIKTPLGLEGEKPKAILYFVKDISESAGYRKMILKLDRNAARGRMARDIAHEINNYLAVLQGNLELAPMFIANQNFEKLESKIEVMKDTVAKITNFTEGLTRFSNENPDYDKEDLHQLIENLVAFIKPQNKFDNVKIETRLSDDLPMVEIDSGQIQLLLVNLINNAAEAQSDLEGESRIVISAEYDSVLNAVKIRVNDGGPGVDPEKLDDIFVKRFSTKRDGTGLGLLTCHNIALNHKGSISFCPDESWQSIFELVIPKDRPIDSDNTETNVKKSVVSTK